MHRSRAVRLDAAFGAAHDGGGLGDIEFFPVTQQEGLALTAGQLRHLGLDRLARSAPVKPSRRRFPTAERPAERFQGLEHVEIAVVAGGVSKSEKFCTTALRTFWRRNQSIVAFDRMRWNSSGSSAAGRSAYFSASRIIASCTMSSAASSSRTA